MERTAEQLAEEVLGTYRELKVVNCAREGGPTDNVPILHARVNGRDTVAALTGGHPADMVGGALKAIAYPDPVEWAVLAVESYVKTAREFPRDMKRGVLADEFANDPTSGVRECLMVYVVLADGQNLCRVQEFSYDDRGVPQFAEVQEHADVSGTIPTRMWAAMR